MRPVAVLHNSVRVPPGRLTPAFQRAGRSWADVRLPAGEPLPDPSGLAAVVVLGGEMGAYDIDVYPYLIEEKDYLRRLVDEDVAVLGICLGAQLLADALGGKAFLADRPEAGVVELRVTGAWLEDPVLSPLPTRVLAVHQDTFDVPPGAELLAESERFPHAFRIGSALGLQFHPEAPASLVHQWAATGADRVIRAAGLGIEEFLAEVEEAEPVLEPAGAALFDRWLASLPDPGN